MTANITECTILSNEHRTYSETYSLIIQSFVEEAVKLVSTPTQTGTEHGAYRTFIVNYRFQKLNISRSISALLPFFSLWIDCHALKTNSLSSSRISYVYADIYVLY